MTSTTTFGMMNHPVRPLAGEIETTKRLGFDFLDLTLEPPEAGVEKFSVEETKKLLEAADLGVVGHTGWHLYGNSVYPEVRRGIAESLIWAASQLGPLGVKHMTYHIHGQVAKYTTLTDAIDAQAETLALAAEGSAAHGVEIMLEHTNAYPWQFEMLEKLFEQIDSLKFHLDVGHANLSDDGTNKTARFFEKFGNRLVHVHLSDNRGQRDEHLPLGVGTVNWPEIAKIFRNHGYDRTITLEVFSEDEDYLALSLKKAREWFG